MKRFSQLITQDVSFYVAITLYGVVALGAAVWLDDLKWFAPQAYLQLWVGGLAVIYLVVAGIWGHRSIKSGDPKGAFTAHLEHLPRYLSGAVLFIWFGIFLGIFTSIKLMLPLLAPFTFDPFFADIDKAIHGADPWVYLHWMTRFEWIVRVFYGPVWFTFVTVISFLVCMSTWSRRKQYIWTFLACWILLGNVIPLMFMAAGPVFYEGITGSQRFSELSDFIFAQAKTGDHSALAPIMLWNSYINQQPGLGLGISAFPSLHVSMATLFALTGFALHKHAGYVMAGYLVFIMAGSVHLGWHYAIDGYVSILVTALIWKMTGVRTADTSSVVLEPQRA